MNFSEATHVVVDLPIINGRQKSDPFGRPYVRHYLDVDARQIPEIPDFANARDATSFKNASVYKEVADSAMDGAIEDNGVTPGLFGYKNLGIIILADHLEKLNEHLARLYIRKPDDEAEVVGGGTVNGGHTLEILRNLQKKYGGSDMPPNFVEVKVYTGIPESATAEVSAVRTRCSRSRVRHSSTWRGFLIR